MKARWQALSARFAAMARREKVLVAAAVAVVIVLGGHTLVVEPARLRAASLAKQLAQQKQELATLQGQLAALKGQVKDPDAPTRAALAEIRAKLAAADGELRRFDAALVPPSRVPQLLQSLLTRHKGLSLVSLATLPPAPLVAPPAEAKDKRAGDAAPAAAPQPGANIYKHGIEIRVAGGYLDLLAYLAELEQAGQQLLWGRMSLAVVAYPRSELTLTVYTFSLDPTWLVV
jgi:MSHA biogenesis protein MshJ